MNEQDYYNVGSRDSIVVSSSSLKYIDPLRGGSPQAFLQFFDERTEEKESRALKLGRMIHLWHENRDAFYISSVNKPSEVMGVIADRCIEQVKLNGVDFTRQLASDISEIMNYQSKWLAATRLEKIYDGIAPYVLEVLQAESDNQIYLTESEKNVIESACASIENHPLAKQLLFMQDNDFSDKSTYKELEVYWEASGLLFKAKIDDFTIDFENKIIYLNDLKSMSGAAYSYGNFQTYKTYQQLAFYTRAIQIYCQQKEIDLTGYRWMYNIIAVETTNLFQCVVWHVSQDWITKGTLEIRELYKRIKWHVTEDEWNYSKEEKENGFFLEMVYREDI